MLKAIYIQMLQCLAALNSYNTSGANEMIFM